MPNSWRWNCVASRFAFALVLFVPHSVTQQIKPMQYFVNNEVIYTNQSTGQSTPNVLDLCILAPECFCSDSCTGLLLDGDTASTDNGNIDLQKFWAFNGSSDGNVRIVGPSNTPVSFIVLYFYNSPNELIGLPDIEITSNSAANSVSYVFTDNNDLSQTDSQVRSVTLSLTQSENDFNIHFLFPDSNKIQYMLISEMGLMDTGPVPSLGPVEFLNNIPPEMTLGPDNPQSSVSFSCTVTNSGSFMWQWEHNGSPVDTSRSQIWTADATRTSTLVLDRLRYTDTGNYTCDVRYSTNNTIYSRSISLVLAAKIVVGSNITVMEDEMVSLQCEVYGYTSEIVWLKNGIPLMPGSSHTITDLAGNSSAQIGGEIPTMSMVSIVNISQAVQEDAGPYTCRMNGTAMQETVVLTVLTVDMNLSSTVLSSTVSKTDVTKTSTGVLSSTMSKTDVTKTSTQGNQNPTIPHTTIIIAPPTTTTPPSTTGPATVQSNSSSTIIIAVVVVLLIVAIIVIVILIVVLFAFRRKTFKSLNFTSYLSSKEEIAAQVEEPFYAEIEKPVKRQALIPAYSEIDTISSRPPPDTIEMKQFNGGPDYQEIPEHRPKPAKLSGTPPSFLQPNNMYCSSEELDRHTPDNQNDIGSQFDIYAKTSTVPPPVPPYKGSPIPDHNEELSPTMFQDPTGFETDSDYLPPYSSIYSDPQPIFKSDVLEVTESNISELKELGVGQFGEVVLAHTVGLSLGDLKISSQANDTNVSILVAVKKLRSDANEGEKDTFEKEIKFMARLHHENVVRLLGVCLTRNAFLMMEYMENGDLNQYLSKCELVSDDAVSLPPKKLNIPILIYMCYQITSGMRYLSSLNFIHRDLATRNCLLGHKYVVKIADFGMSRSLYTSVYYRISGRAVLPLRWMATECFYGRFSEKSDVWAFGVTAWEIFTLCKMQPYEDWTDQEVIDDAVKEDKRIRLPQPEDCPDEIYHVMQSCWAHDPKKRSTFEDLYSLLAQIHAYSDIA